MLPTDFKARMAADLGDEYDAFIREYENPPHRGFRVNTLKISPEELLPLFPYSLGQVPWCKNGFYYSIRAGKHLCSRSGLIYSQEPSAMVAAQLLNPSPGEKVLDLCAAPGGKSTQLAAMLKGEGLLVSNEIIPGRAAILTENIERIGISNAVVTNMSPEKMEKEFALFFDKILVDAPCSGEGMFRRDETAIAQWSIEHTLSCAVRQLHILKSAFKMLRGGGELVYSTCTFSKAENEEVCERILKECPDVSLISEHRIMPHTHKGEGHFAAKFVKNGGGQRSRASASERADISLFRTFEKENLNTYLTGSFTAFGERLYLTPDCFGTLNSVKAVRPGLYLGDNKKGRFEPSHHLCMALKSADFRRSVSVGEDDALRYFSGLTLPCSPSIRGFGAVLWEGFPIGWGKASEGIIKNHIPKYLRG